MEKQTVLQAGNEEKLMLKMIPLSSWREVLISQHLKEGVYMKEARHIHHCSGCDCVMICSYKYCAGFHMTCPECSTKNKTPQGGN